MGVKGLFIKHTGSITVGIVLFIYLFLLVGNAMGFAFWLPSCPIYKLTGFQCFGCGSNRAVVALIQGDIHKAWEYNVFVFLYLGLFMLYVIIKLNHFLKIKRKNQ